MTSQRTALIGHTGFIGSNIAATRDFDDVYNTTNIEQIRGKQYDMVVSAAGRADSHRINNAPEADRAELETFAEILEGAHIDKLVHISTVCIFDNADRCDEATESDLSRVTPYGVNRLALCLLYTSPSPRD